MHKNRCIKSVILIGFKFFIGNLPFLEKDSNSWTVQHKQSAIFTLV